MRRRPDLVRRAIQRESETAISRMMLRGEVTAGALVRVDFSDGAFRFQAERRPAPEPPPNPERPEAGSGVAPR